MNSPTNPQVLSIDIPRKAVHWGKNPDSGWWVNGTQYVRKSDAPEYSPDADGNYGNKGCSYSVTEYVRISDNVIEFGNIEVNINDCGFYGGRDNMPLMAKGEGKTITKYAIARDTGIYVLLSPLYV